MDSLLCDEFNWLASPVHHRDQNQLEQQNHAMAAAKSESCYSSCGGAALYASATSTEDWQQAFAVCLEKEVSYMPQPGYHDCLRPSSDTDHLAIARFRAMQWLVKSQSRLNLSFETISNAANYFDRFLSMNLCDGWKCWMFELLAIACLSVASKFGETLHPPLHEIQMEDLDHSFQLTLIQRMELTLLKALGWRLASITAASYVELLIWNTDYSLTARFTQLLLDSISDSKFVKFRPSVIAISALRCAIEESVPSTYSAYLACVTSLIPQDQKDDLIKCHEIMEERVLLVCPFPNLITRSGCSSCCGPSSPVTVLTIIEQVAIHDFTSICTSLRCCMPMPSGSEINPRPRKILKRKREE